MEFSGTARRALGSAASRTVPRQQLPIHIRLNGLPRTSTPADITRMLAKNKIENIAKVALDYHRFSPSGSAYITLSHPDFMRKTVMALQQLTFFSLPLKAAPVLAPEEPPARVRGQKGREEAAQRAIVTGNGSRGGIWDNGKSVVICGMPNKMSVDGVRKFLKNYKLAGGQGEVVKMDPIQKSFTPFSRIFVRLTSQSEAYRLVRNIHMTYFEPGAWDDKYLIRARIIY